MPEMRIIRQVCALADWRRLPHGQSGCAAITERRHLRLMLGAAGERSPAYKAAGNTQSGIRRRSSGAAAVQHDDGMPPGSPLECLFIW